MILHYLDWAIIIAYFKFLKIIISCENKTNTLWNTK